MNLVLATLCLLFATIFAADIDDYVNKFDENYEWTYLGPDTDIHGRNIKGDHAWTGYMLNITSQR